MPYVLFILISLLWGSNFILMKKASEMFGSVTVGALRVLGGALALVWILWSAAGRADRKKDGPGLLEAGAAGDEVVGGDGTSAGGGWVLESSAGLAPIPPPASIWNRYATRWGMRREHFWPFFWVILLGYGYPYVAQPRLIRLHGSGFQAMMVCLVPLMTVLVSLHLLRVKPSVRQFVGVLGGLGCMALMMADGWKRAIPPLDLAMAAAVPMMYSVANTLVKAKLRDVPALPLTFVSLLVTGVVLLPVGLATEPIHWPEGRVAQSIWAMAFLGMVGTGLATWIFYKLIQDHGPLFASMSTYLVPVVALGWSLLDGEQVTGLQLLALTGAIGCVVVVQYGSARPGRARG